MVGEAREKGKFWRNSARKMTKNNRVLNNTAVQIEFIVYDLLVIILNPSSKI